MKKILGALVLMLLITACNSTKKTVGTKQVLVFTKTMGWRHGSIEKGVATLKEIGAQEGWQITQSEDSLAFNTENLAKTDLVIFLSTTGDILGPDQEAAFKSYIQNGGAFMGIHAATDTEFDWPWYGKLVGGYFKDHPNNPNVRKASLKKEKIAALSIVAFA